VRSWTRVSICASCFHGREAGQTLKYLGGYQNNTLSLFFLEKVADSFITLQSLPKPYLSLNSRFKNLQNPKSYAGDELRGWEHPEKITCTCEQRSSSSSSSRPLNVPHIRHGLDRSVDTETQTYRRGHRDRTHST
jgi:hypothetical protein